MTAMLKIKKLPVSFFELTLFFRKESTNSPRIETIDILFRIQNPNFLKIKKKITINEIIRKWKLGNFAIY